jgi:hypothetical protein
MKTRGWRPFGFVLLMLGFGLRLDTGWQALAWLFLVTGAACAAAGWWPGTRPEAFVSAPGGR